MHRHSTWRRAPLAGLACLVAAVMTLAAPPAPATAAVPHDRFDQAVGVLDVYAEVALDVSEATAEPGEPVHGGVGAGRSVWLRWEPPVSGAATVEADTSGGPVVMAVYTGRTVDDLSPVADSAGTLPGARLHFPVRAYTAYWLALDAVAGAPPASSARVRLLASTPPDDDLAAARLLQGAAGAVSTTLTHATREAGEPDHGTGAGGSVWSSWTAPADGELVLRVAGAGGSAPALRVYRGDGVATLAAVPTRHSEGNVRVRVTAGSTYLVALVETQPSASLGEGDATLAWSFTSPANDDLQGAQALSGDGREVVAGPATAEPGEPPHAGEPAARSRWYRYTAAAAGVADFRATGPQVRLAAYRGPAVDALVLLAGSTGADRHDDLAVPMAAGEQVLVVVDAAGSAPFDLVYGLRGPDNDRPADATPVATDVAAVGTTLGAGQLAGEPLVPGGSGRSVWWSYTAVSARPLVVQTVGSGFDTVLAVHEATGARRLVAADGDSGPGTSSLVHLRPRRGTTYLIGVDGAGGQSGSVTLSVGGAVLRVSDVSVPESAGQAFLTLVRSPASGAATVRYTARPRGSAAAVTQKARFLPGADTVVVPVSVRDDALHEAGDHVDVVVEPAGGLAVLDGGRARVHLVDDDAPPVLQVTAAPVEEGAGPLQVRVGLDRPSGRPVTVQVATADDGRAVPRPAALAGLDYDAALMEVVLLPGDTGRTLPVALRDDDVDEPDEALLVVAGPLTGATTAGPAVVVVLDDEPPPVLTIEDLTFDEGASGTVVPIEVVVRLSGPSASTVAFTFASVDGTARRPFDYRRAEGEVLMPPGTVQTAITVVTRPDNLVEGDEDFFLELLQARGATLGRSVGRIVILDDD